MTSHLHEPSDAEYLARARAGDDDAFAALFARHRDAAFRAANRWTTPDRADDLVAEAFARIYRLLRDGGGPTVTFRSYLLAAVRSLHLDTVRRDRRHTWMGDLTVLGDLVAIDDDSDRRFRTAAIGRAFRSLPERWQAVLWLTAIEGLAVAEVADLLDMKPHAVSQLGFRAREGLRQHYLAEHLSEIEDDRCARFVDLLPGYVRGGLNASRSAKVANHVAGCLRCSTAVAEIAAINKDLAVLLLPLAVGGSAVLPAPALPPARTSPPGRVVAAVLAGVLAGVLVLGAVLLLHPRDSGGVPVTAPAAPPVRPATPPVRPAPSPPPAAPSPSSTGPPTGPPARTVLRAAPVSTPRVHPTPLAGPARLVRPAPLLEDLALGPVTVEVVDPARPRVLHVAFAVRRAVPDAVAVLRVVPAPARVEVHRDSPYGDWRCHLSGVTLRCRLAGARGSADLAVDLWTTGPGRASLVLSLPGVPDPAPADNRVQVPLRP